MWSVLARAGSFGEVFRGVWRGTEVAIKVMLEQDFTEENTADFCTEIALLRCVTISYFSGRHEGLLVVCFA